MNFGVIGYGYWGPNVVRNLATLEGSRVISIADLDPAARQRAQRAYPSVHVTSCPTEVVTSTKIDAIAIVSPVWTHYELAKTALLNGKHVFVEKPFTLNSAQGEELVEIAESRNLKIMVDHTFLFTGAVRKMKEMIDDGSLGNLYYYDSTRINLGLLQHDVNVLWDLAPHDLSIMDHLIPGDPEAVGATGEKHLNCHEDVAYMTLYFPNKVIAHINVNWLSPVKVRMTLIGGEKRMVVWNDLVADEKVRVYDRGVNTETQEGIHKLLVNYRSGDMWAPRLEPVEALQQEMKYFVECIEKGTVPFNDGKAGLRVVRMLEAASESLAKRGALVYL
ncbi:Gfo/Idh/MocA family oxidoreductase [Acidobacteria bacterium AB60]|nr:Gfo/Idh/MocA family oxidoreductase [Acidobacteria bacterium AB60]